ncbi:hypothetical protein JCM10212_005493 [Sporobolomyces blumeae]
MFLCIPIICGPNSSLKQENDDLCYCPRCGNASVRGFKRRKWFELYWIPLVPLGTKHLWLCPVCQWNCPTDGSFQPQPVNSTGHAPPPTHAGHAAGQASATAHAGRGYDVGYSTQQAGGYGAKTAQ